MRVVPEIAKLPGVAVVLETLDAARIAVVGSVPVALNSLAYNEFGRKITCWLRLLLDLSTGYLPSFEIAGRNRLL